MLVVAAGVAFVTSAVACATAMVVLRRLGVVDVPNARSSHRRPTVRGVGVGAAVGTVAGLVASRLFSSTSWPWHRALVLIVASLSAGLIGLVDDLRGGVSFGGRLLAQAALASAVVVTLGIGDVTMPWRVLIPLVAVVWIVGYVNAFNFMDGINGISGVTALVVGATFAAVGRLESLPLLEAGGAALAAASLGFLPFNFPTARAFLGDVGSYFLGAWIALLAYVALLSGVRLDVVLAPLALYLADVGLTLAKRVRRGEQWHAAHRDHAYQRLAAGGLGHTGTTLVVLALTLVLSGLGLASLRLPGWRIVTWLAMAGMVATYLAAPFLLRRHHDRRAVAREAKASTRPATQGDRATRGPASP